MMFDLYFLIFGGHRLIIKMPTTQRKQIRLPRDRYISLGLPIEQSDPFTARQVRDQIFFSAS